MTSHSKHIFVLHHIFPKYDRHHLNLEPHIEIFVTYLETQLAILSLYIYTYTESNVFC
jgi:hypothetical protein